MPRSRILSISLLASSFATIRLPSPRTGHWAPDIRLVGRSDEEFRSRRFRRKRTVVRCRRRVGPLFAIRDRPLAQQVATVRAGADRPSQAFRAGSQAPWTPIFRRADTRRQPQRQSAATDAVLRDRPQTRPRAPRSHPVSAAPLPVRRRSPSAAVSASSGERGIGSSRCSRGTLSVLTSSNSLMSRSSVAMRDCTRMPSSPSSGRPQRLGGDDVGGAHCV